MNFLEKKPITLVCELRIPITFSRQSALFLWGYRMYSSTQLYGRAVILIPASGIVRKIVFSTCPLILYHYMAELSHPASKLRQNKTQSRYYSLVSTFSERTDTEWSLFFLLSSKLIIIISWYKNLVTVESNPTWAKWLCKSKVSLNIAKEGKKKNILKYHFLTHTCTLNVNQFW